MVFGVQEGDSSDQMYMSALERADFLSGFQLKVFSASLTVVRTTSYLCMDVDIAA